MNDKLALGLLSEVMGWANDDSIAAQEYQWLRLMGAAKYDGYSDFRAGVRFLESFATWLKQFAQPDRQAAYDFVKNRLVYISFPELQRLIEAFVPEIVTPVVRRVAAQELKIKPYEIWSTPEGFECFKDHLRKVLIVGMSDGSRIDYLRRANAKLLSTEQIVPMMNIDAEKWEDLNSKLEKACGTGAKFTHVYLIDDFTASGTTFIRQTPEGGWKGKLSNFNKLIIKSRDLGDKFPITDGYHLHIHHYISSYQARTALEERIADAEQNWMEKSFGTIDISQGLLLPETAKLDVASDAAILDICKNYYDHALFKRLEKHCREAGQTTMMYGYADCALPVVLDHNTPNNSIPLLWAETPGEDGAHAMRPLFFRRDRHG
ncbi:MAG: hypothetical protein AB7S70_07735 [Hyphomicrobium sp.]